MVQAHAKCGRVVQARCRSEADPTAITDAQLRALDGSALMYALSGFQLPIVDGVGLVGEPAVLARQGKQHDVPLIMGGSSFEGTVQPASGITLDDFRRFHEHDWITARQLYAEDFGVSEEFGLEKCLATIVTCSPPARWCVV